jgi:hypothetical protein
LRARRQYQNSAQRTRNDTHAWRPEVIEAMTRGRAGRR